MARLGIIGSAGRMGHALTQAIADAGHDLAGGIDKGGDPAPLAQAADALIDFSVPVALPENLAAAQTANVPILIGTTGLNDAHHHAIDAAAKVIPVLQTGNTSLGVTLMAHMIKEAAFRLKDGWDIEIVEMHHRLKLDAPSGTAMLLGEAAAQGRNVSLAEHQESARDGHTGPRKSGTIGFAALRGGTVAGDHSVIFAGDEERLTFTHNAENRMVFARGAVKAAEWLIGNMPGRYTMNEVLDIR